jgi:hypothetical protein
MKRNKAKSQHNSIVIKHSKPKKINTYKPITIGDTVLVPNGGDSNEMLYINNKYKQKMNKDELITSSTKSKVMHAVIKPDGHMRCVVNLTIKELEKLLKEAKKRKKQFKSSTFFIHPSPDFSIFWGENDK